MYDHNYTEIGCPARGALAINQRALVQAEKLERQQAGWMREHQPDGFAISGGLKGLLARLQVNLLPLSRPLASAGAK